MKKLVLIFIFALFLFSCDSEKMEEQDTGSFSLIGTWEAEGEFKDYPSGTYTCKITLVFLDDTNYEDEIIYTSFVRPHGKHKGTYTRTDDNIIYKTLDSDGINYSNTYTHKYRFVNKNTLETLAISIAPELNDKATFRRKN